MSKKPHTRDDRTQRRFEDNSMRRTNEQQTATLKAKTDMRSLELRTNQLTQEVNNLKRRNQELENEVLDLKRNLRDSLDEMKHTANAYSEQETMYSNQIETLISEVETLKRQRESALAAMAEMEHKWFGSILDVNISEEKILIYYENFFNLFVSDIVEEISQISGSNYVSVHKNLLQVIECVYNAVTKELMSIGGASLIPPKYTKLRYSMERLSGRLLLTQEAQNMFKELKEALFEKHYKIIMEKFEDKYAIAVHKILKMTTELAFMCVLLNLRAENFSCYLSFKTPIWFNLSESLSHQEGALEFSPHETEIAQRCMEDSGIKDAQFYILWPFLIHSDKENGIVISERVSAFKLKDLRPKPAESSNPGTTCKDSKSTQIEKTAEAKLGKQSKDSKLEVEKGSALKPAKDVSKKQSKDSKLEVEKGSAPKPAKDVSKKQSKDSNLEEFSKVSVSKSKAKSGK